MEFVKDKKRDYLIKTFSRTKRKDFENYILTAIWHKLDNLDIQPVSQQYVDFGDGKYALIDLYFPQLNIGVECDEFHHTKNQIEDLSREISIEEKLSAITKFNLNENLIRIKAYESIDSIQKQIDLAVEKINKKIATTKFEIWDANFSAIEAAVTKGSISIEDNFGFEKLVDIANLFGKEYKGLQRSFITLKKGLKLWCPHLAIEKGGEKVAARDEWLNVLSDDWSYIFETNSSKDLSKLEFDPEEVRYTFAKSKDCLGRNVYKFIGVFKYVGIENNVRKYEQISTIVKL